MQEPISRRAFNAGLGLLLLKPEIVRGSQANSAIRLGLLGCGNRGTTVATSFARNTSARVVALADIFPDKVDAAKQHFGTVNSSLGYGAPETFFTGYRAYEELAASNAVDVIQISTPPYFHVEHLRAAVAGGKHAYCEKPVGVDVSQTQQALAIAESVHGKVSVEVGFQIRKAPPFVELVNRIHNGALGKIVSIDAHYYAPASKYPDRPASMSKDEVRLRDWLWDLVLSGDIVVEQDIHVVDICNWILQAHPISAYAAGSRAVLQHAGDCFDNYEIVYTYPEGVHVTLNAKQYGQTNDFDVSEQVLGSLGYSVSPYSGPLKITGQNAWEWQGNPETPHDGSAFAANGAFSDNLALADSEKEKSFIDSITSGKYHNQIADGVLTARSAILARMAAREKRVVSWNEMLASKEHWHLDIDLRQFKG